MDNLLTISNDQVCALATSEDLCREFIVNVAIFASKLEMHGDKFLSETDFAHTSYLAAHVARKSCEPVLELLRSIESISERVGEITE